MKFAEHLGAHITPEWRKQYIRYEAMKEKLYETVENAPSTEIDEDAIERHFAMFDETFFQFCDMELLKINTFFSEKLNEASRKFATLKSELEMAAQQQRDVRLRKKPKGYSKSAELHINSRKLHEIKLAFSEFYLSLILLQNYQTLNFTGFRKILKKHDKLLRTERGANWRQNNVETAPFYTSKAVDHLIKQTESIVTTRLEGGDRGKAMKRLRVPPLGEQQHPWTTFRFGLFSGVFIVLVIAIVIAAYVTKQEHLRDWEAALRMYRGVFLVILCTFLLGINTYGWRSSGVNHVLIFELDPRSHLTHQQLLEVASMFGVLWSISLLCYVFGSYLYVPVFAHPLSLVLFCLLFLINPLKILHYKARRWLLRVLFRIFTAPFHYVGFADFWLADQLNSLSIMLLDFEFLICYYAVDISWHNTSGTEVCGSNKYGIRPIVACLPAWFRFAQCLRRYRDTRLFFPHIVNAGKYSTTFFVVLFNTLNSVFKENNEDDNNAKNTFFYLWIMSCVISTLYTYTWDIKMDWGLMDKNAGENRFLREEIVYAYKGYYYFAIIEDLCLRFAWTLTASVGENVLHNEILRTSLASLEVFRRFIWNFFRLENEHLNNCGDFRAVRDISIAPLDTSDLKNIEDMMDNMDGINTRGRMGKVKAAPSGARYQGLINEENALEV